MQKNKEIAMSIPLIINGDNFELTEALKSLSTKKINHLTYTYKQISHITVTFKVENLDQIASGIVKVPGKEFTAQANSDDMYKSIDLLVDKLSTQLRKYKEKLSSH